MKYHLRDLVDLEKLQVLTDRLYEATQIPSSIITMDGEILTGSGWQRICTDFHRKHPKIEKDCIESDTRINEQMLAGEPFSMYTCPRGLTDAAIPIVIAGEHLANAFVGQIFLDQPDAATERFFREQAREFGLDEEPYLEAFREVPIMPLKSFRSALTFLAELAKMIAELGFQRLKELETREELAASQARYRFLVDNLNEMVVQFDGERNIEFASPSYCKVFGVKDEEILGKPFFPRIHEDDLPRVKRSIESLARPPHLTKHEERALTVDGWRWLEWSVRAVVDDLGRITSNVAVGRDITEQKRADEQRRASEQRFLKAFQHAPAVMTISTIEDGRYLEVNDAFVQVSGFAREQAVGFSSVETGLVPVEEREKLSRMLAAGGGVHDHEINLVKADGSPLRGLYSGEIIEVDGEERLLSIVVDITERVTAEKELAESEDRYRSLVDNLTEAVALHEIITDDEGEPVDFIFLDCNPTYEKLTQLKRSEILGKRGLEVLPNLEPRWIERYGHVALTGEARTIVDHSDYLDRYWEVRVFSPKERQFAVAFTDVTERIKSAERLERSNRRWKQAQRVAKIGNWEFDVSTSRVWASEGAFQVLGLPLDVGENPTQHISLEEAASFIFESERVVGALQELIEQEKPYDLEFKILTRESGEERFIHSKAELERDRDGRPIKISGTVQDITARKLAEAELKKFRTIADRAVHGSTISETDGTIIYVNEAFASVHGYRADELIGRNTSVFHTEQQVELVQRLNERLSRDGSLPALEVWHVHRDGTEFPMLMSAVVLYGEDGAPLYLAGTAIDITERKKVEERYRIINDASQDFIYSYDLEGRFTSANKSLCESLQMTEAEIIGKNHAEIGFQREQCDEWDRLHEQVHASLSTVNVETTTPMPDGSLRHHEVILNPLFDERGAVIGISGLTRDITDRVLAEREKDRVTAQLQQSQKMESIGRLAGGVAHDFNNLLTAITGNVSLVLMDLNEDDDLVEPLREVDKAADSAARLTKQLLTFSRRQIIDPKKVDLNELIANVHKMLVRLIGEDIELRLDRAENLGSIKADPSQIEQILINLSVNARDAMPDGGRLTLGTSMVAFEDERACIHPDAHPGEYVVLTVIDDGFGMDEETQRKLFDPFFTTKKEGEGTGLGMAMVYGIVSQHGGFIEIDSAPQEGTTIRVFFPKVEGEAESAQKDASNQGLPAGKECVLVVEDEPMVRNIALRILERLGYEVHFAEDGESALALVEEKGLHPDLLLTDIVMPNMNGRELAQRMTLQLPDLEVLFTSGYSENVIAHHGVLEEGLHFMSKPYSPESLAKMIRQVLDG